MTNHDIILHFQPTIIPIRDIHLLKALLEQSQLLLYGEIHGIQENAHIIYTLVHQLNIRQLAIEASPRIATFIQAASNDIYDCSLIDNDTFDTSILSLEMAKTIAALIREGRLQHVHYIDTYFDTLQPTEIDHPDSPQQREQMLAENITALNALEPTLCLFGQWHTQPHPVELNDGTIHTSALYRIRQTLPHTPCIHVAYKEGSAYNDNHILTLPRRADVSDNYCIKPLTSDDFDLHVPQAHHSANEKQSSSATT